MSEYKAELSGLGYTIYKQDHKMIKATKIPGNIFPLLKVGGPVISDEGMKLEAPLHPCVFCKEMTKTLRLINMQTIYLCNEHYYSKTTGQVIQQVREPSYEVANEKPQGAKAGQGETFKSKYES